VPLTNLHLEISQNKKFHPEITHKILHPKNYPPHTVQTAIENTNTPN